jgi:hypothetical protein
VRKNANDKSCRNVAILNTNSKSLLRDLHQSPRMHASDKEAFLCIISTVLFLNIENFNTILFFERFCKQEELKDCFSDDWARRVVNDALDLL